MTMSEKRFIFATNEKWFLFDNETEEYMDMEDCKDKLNEQQATIQFLQDEIDELKKDIDIYKYEEKKHSESARKLYEENRELRKELNDCEKFRYTVFKRIGELNDER